MEDSRPQITIGTEDTEMFKRLEPVGKSSGLVVIALSLIAGCATPTARIGSADKEGVIGTISTQQVVAASLALNDFRLNNSKWQCFDVDISRSEGQNRIDFSPRDDVQRDGRRLVIGASGCGVSMTYFVDDQGKITYRGVQK